MGRGKVPNNVRRLREQAGLSQQALANKAKVGLGTVKNIENEQPISLRTIDRIAGALGVSIVALLSVDEEVAS